MRTQTIFFAAVAALGPFARAVEMDPGDGGTCFTSTIAIGITELLVIFNLIPDVDMSTQRTYIICPGETITIGVQEPGSNPPIFQGGDFPLPIFNPNINVKCGETGENSNGCVLSGGRDQIVSLVDTQLLEQFLLFLPLLVPDLAFLPSELPEGYKPDSSNLLIEGLTFEKSIGDPEQGVTAPINLAGPGREMVFSDCRWIYSDNAVPPTAGLAASYNEAAHTGDGPYISLTIKGSAFANNTFTDAVVWTGWAEGQYGPGLPLDGLSVNVEDCLFMGNILLEGQVLGLQFTDASVSLSCFVDNTMTQGSGVAAGYNSTVSNLDNYGMDNDISVFGCATSEGEIKSCDIATFNIFVDSSGETTTTDVCPSSCDDFSAQDCPFDIVDKASGGEKEKDGIGAATPPPEGDSYCTFDPDYECYESGWPSCCGDDSEECPEERPTCDEVDQDVTPTQTPTNGEVTCQICPDGSAMPNPTQVTQHSKVRGMTCDELRSRSAFLPTDGMDCLNAQALSIIDCGCPYVAPAVSQCPLCAGGVPVPNPSKLFNPKDSSKICGAFEWQAAFFDSGNQGECLALQATAGAACDCQDAPAPPCDASCPNGAKFDLLKPLTDATVGEFMWKGEWLCGEILWAESVEISECTELVKRDLRRKCCPGGGVVIQEITPSPTPAPTPSSAVSALPSFVWILVSLVGLSFGN